MVKKWQHLLKGTLSHAQNYIMLKKWQILIYIGTPLHGQDSIMVKTWQILI